MFLFVQFTSHQQYFLVLFYFYFLYVIIITILFGAFLSSISCLTLKFILFVLTILFLIVLSSCFVAYVSDGGSIYFFLYDFSLKALVFSYRNDMYLLSYDKVFWFFWKKIMESIFLAKKICFIHKILSVQNFVRTFFCAH